MASTDILKHEHHLILSVLKGAKREAQQIGSSGRVDVEAIERIIDFSKNFTDRNHHAKEEGSLFPKMIDRGAWKDGPIAAMIREHKDGRLLINAMSEALERFKKNEASAANLLRENLGRYVDLMWWHIQKEESIVFEMAGSFFTLKDQDELERQFRTIEKQILGESAYEHYAQLARDVS